MVGSHKHDGTSPLPLGMESSPPPENWTGRTTQWPTDQQVGWTYCVTIPRWKIINAPSGLTFHPTAFFVVEVGIRSPSGLSSLHAFLRRFSDFLRLYSSLKASFPKKHIPPPPPKNILSRMTSPDELQQRREMLADWMQSLLEDMEFSRSVPLATFLELERASRKAVNLEEAEDKPNNIPSKVQESEGILQSEGSHSKSLKEDESEESASEISQTHNFPDVESLSGTGPLEESQRGETSGGGRIGLERTTSGASGASEGITGIILPSSDREVLREIWEELERRLKTCTLDMEDMRARLRQEMAVKDFLSSRVKDLEGEVDRERRVREEVVSRVRLEEREKSTETHWEREELRAQNEELKEALQREQAARELLEQQMEENELRIGQVEVEAMEAKLEVESLRQEREESENAWRIERRTLAKEVKGLRAIVAELELKLGDLKEEREAEKVQLAQKEEELEKSEKDMENMTREVDHLLKRLRECSLEQLARERGVELKPQSHSPSSEEIDGLLGTSDSRLGLLIAEIELLETENKSSTKQSKNGPVGQNFKISDLVVQLLADNARIRRRVNTLMRKAASHGWDGLNLPS